MNTTRVIRFASIALAIFMLVGLGVWYTYIRNQEAAIQTADAGRGAGEETPSFAGAIGSTYQNIVTAITGGKKDGAALGRLSRISATPVAGFGFIGTASSTAIRFVERSTGNVLDIDTATGVIERRTNTLIAQVQEALIAHDTVILRTVGEDEAIITSAASVSIASSGPLSLIERPLPKNISAIALSPNGAEIFYIDTNKNAGVRARWDNGDPKELLPLSIAGWDISWLADGQIVLVQKPSDDVAGYAYTLNTKGVLEPLVRATPGLTLVARAQRTGETDRALIFGSADTSLTLSAKLRATAAPIALPVRTTADKCVWSVGKELVAFCAVPQSLPGPGYLEKRARGEIHSSDSWWRINASANTAELLYAPSASLDVESPMIDASGTFIAFRNGADKSLWLLRITADN